MCELTDRARALETKLSDLDAPLLEVALAAARLLLEDERTNENTVALTGCLMMAEFIVEHLEAKDGPFAVDGDVHFRGASFAPGRPIKALCEALKQAEREAVEQKRAVLTPLFNEIISAGARDVDSVH
jgi:hypothetical protein